MSVLSLLDLKYAWILIPLCFLFVGSILGIVLLAKIPLVYNIRNLTVRFVTTLLTATAFTMVIGVLTLMMGFINGLKHLTQSSGVPENVIVLSQGATDEGFSNLPFENMADIAQLDGVARLNEEPLCSREAYLVLSLPVVDPQPGRPTRRLLQLRGVFDPVASGTVHNISLLPGGSWFSEAGVRAQLDLNENPMIEVVLGQGIARELAHDLPEKTRLARKNVDSLDVGDTIQLESRKLLVTGIMKTEGTTFDSEVWSKQNVVGPLLGKNYFTTLVLRATSGEEGRNWKIFFRARMKATNMKSRKSTHSPSPTISRHSGKPTCSYCSGPFWSQL